MTVLERKEIESLLPHREPFLFIDRVLEIGDKTGIAVKKVLPTEYYFRGHFPGEPVMPAVLLVEALAQLGGLLELRRRGLAGRICYLAGIDSARFRSPVFPGDMLTLEVKLLKARKRFAVSEGRARVGDRVVCEATLMFAYKGEVTRDNAEAL